MPLKVNKTDFAEKVLKLQGVAVADFYSDSCVPCKKLSPVLADLEERQQSVEVFKVNVAYETELVRNYNIRSTPTLVFFINGQEVGRTSGYISLTDLEEYINSLL